MTRESVSLAQVRPGQVNNSVRVLQRALAKEVASVFPEAMLTSPEFGTYGPVTKEAVAQVQRNLGYHGGDADGVIGAATLRYLAGKYGFDAVVATESHTVAATPGKLSLSQVLYHDPHDKSGEAAMRAYAQRACELTGMDPRFGVPALVTIAKRESSYNDPRWRVNTTDVNAHGPRVADGHPQNCSRGVTQCIPSTFAAYHQAGTALTPYDVVACMCATINYVRARYGVDRSGANFAARVQQADPHRSPRGY
ncbi:peptidoglycan-binding protein [Streptomyces sp. NPDC007861]|uniref:peptidoglycan-binding protein n=1 Tax=Streptomyces sp. NPDC007861 TaxID=3154893 RepID=UPI0033E98B13